MKEKVFTFMREGMVWISFLRLSVAGLIVVLLSSFFTGEGQDHYSIYLDGY